MGILISYYIIHKVSNSYCNASKPCHAFCSIVKLSCSRGEPSLTHFVFFICPEHMLSESITLDLTAVTKIQDQETSMSLCLKLFLF